MTDDDSALLGLSTDKIEQIAMAYMSTCQYMSAYVGEEEVRLLGGGGSDPDLHTCAFYLVKVLMSKQLGRRATDAETEQCFALMSVWKWKMYGGGPQLTE